MATPRHRFLISSDQIEAGEVRFPAVTARQMRLVLRIREGDRVSAFVAGGPEWTVTIKTLRNQYAVGIVESVVERSTEAGLCLTLYQALLPRERMELVLQKGTELGVWRFVPLVTARSLIPPSALDAGRLTRWGRILSEATEQSGRVTPPTMERPQEFKAAVAQACADGPALLAWEREPLLGVQAILRDLFGGGGLNHLALFVGPEGGFSEEEVSLAKRAGVRTVSLGARTLRAETAGIVLPALVLAAAGEMEPSCS